MHAPLAIGSVLYMVPLVWLKGWSYFGITLALWALIGLCFILSPVMHGYSHMISHVLFSPLGCMLLRAAYAIDE